MSSAMRGTSIVAHRHTARTTTAGVQWRKRAAPQSGTHHQRKEGQMIDSFRGDYEFLSNFYPCRIAYDGAIYRSVEFAYQAAKTHNEEERRAIRMAATSGEAKRLGRKVKIRDDWELLKLDIMHDLLVQKFRDPGLRFLLIATDPHTLIEGNWWGDTYWGVCNGHGENHLGELLMQIRHRLIEEDAPLEEL